MTITPHFAALLQNFERHKKAIAGLESPNPEDDEYIKAAIVGFSFHQPTEAWSLKQCDFIKERRNGEYSDKQLQAYDEKARDYALFACLAHGYLLGLFQAGTLDEIQFATAEAQLPGFLELHMNRL